MPKKKKARNGAATGDCRVLSTQCNAQSILNTQHTAHSAMCRESIIKKQHPSLSPHNSKCREPAGTTHRITKRNLEGGGPLESSLQAPPIEKDSRKRCRGKENANNCCGQARGGKKKSNTKQALSPPQSVAYNRCHKEETKNFFFPYSPYSASTMVQGGR